MNPRFVYIGKVMPDVRWHNKYSVHPHHELIVVLGGVMHISGKTQKLTLRAGEAALYPAGVHHWEQSDESEPVESCFIVFEDPDFSADEILVCRNQNGLLRPLTAALYEQSLFMQGIPCANDYLLLMLKLFQGGTASTDKESEFIRKTHTFMRKQLEKEADGNPDIVFAGRATRPQLRKYYAEARGLIFPGIEDFGIVPLESQSVGVPVIALGIGGALETVVSRKTGVFFSAPEVDCLCHAIEEFEALRFDRQYIINHARKFHRDVFVKNMRDVLGLN